MIAYEKKLSSSILIPKSTKLNEELEMKRKLILKSFSVARNIYRSDSHMVASRSSELEAGAEFLQVT